MRRFSVDEGLFKLFPELRIGVIICEVNNTEYGDDGLDKVIEELKASFSYNRPQEHPRIKVWREAFTKLGIPASKYFSSIESLLRRALKGGPFPRINPLVDLYNAISLKHLAPMGGHAMELLAGDIALCFADGDEPFLPMDGSEEESVDKGEVVYKDEKEVLTRKWVWRQCEKTKITVDTRRIFIPIDVMEGLPDGICKAIMADMEEAILKNRYGRVIHKDILTINKTSTEFEV
jgi:DNA/RNA-binding domain of Phe-tRNA-synthetase-like protein